MLHYNAAKQDACLRERGVFADLRQLKLAFTAHIRRHTHSTFWCSHINFYKKCQLFHALKFLTTHILIVCSYCFCILFTWKMSNKLLLLLLLLRLQDACRLSCKKEEMRKLSGFISTKMRWLHSVCIYVCVCVRVDKCIIKSRNFPTV